MHSATPDYRKRAHGRHREQTRRAARSPRRRDAIAGIRGCGSWDRGPRLSACMIVPAVERIVSHVAIFSSVLITLNHTRRDRVRDNIYQR